MWFVLFEWRHGIGPSLGARRLVPRGTIRSVVPLWARRCHERLTDLELCDVCLFLLLLACSVRPLLPLPGSWFRAPFHCSTRPVWSLTTLPTRIAPDTHPHICVVAFGGVQRWDRGVVFAACWLEASGLHGQSVTEASVGSRQRRRGAAASGARALPRLLRCEWPVALHNHGRRR